MHLKNKYSCASTNKVENKLSKKRDDWTKKNRPKNFWSKKIIDQNILFSDKLFENNNSYIKVNKSEKKSIK